MKKKDIVILEATKGLIGSVLQDRLKYSDEKTDYRTRDLNRAQKAISKIIRKYASKGKSK